MPTLTADLTAMATYITAHGLHTGEQLIGHDTGDIDIAALAYITAERCTPPRAFFDDEAASLRLIENSAPTMQLLHAISAVLDTEPCTTLTDDGVEIPDYIEHISNWTATPPIGRKTPPTRDEITDRLRTAAANTARTTGVPTQRTTSPTAVSRFPRQRAA
ncbi:hypothetical protein [Streptomyces sp. WAC08241]|uniref:hypothetical protein n=1 Tax=Streptomyces sp. WAC08241 TaxID=2487421 RepID=UPI000F7A0BA7|nr:hypothetical protein [Streptomyces sp. WAC08241]RSS33782.1 hypothetical protein EF906_31100 [Streptomyces sp. WAC08241]